jgi:biopolymer transport protein ExbD
MAKKVNVELNMTPFIGLFALLVVMLLLTAVWNRLFVLSTNTAATSASDSPPPPQKKEVSLSLTIMPNHIEMNEDQSSTNVPHAPDGSVDTMRMVQVLNQWRQRHPDKKDVILNTENSVHYQKLITVFDTLVDNDWPDVGVSTQ